MFLTRNIIAVAALAILLSASGPTAQTPPVPRAPVTNDKVTTNEKVTPAQLKSAIDLLGSVDFPIRMDAARTVRRADSAMAVPALIEAINSHADGYVRFKALVVLSGFNDPRIADVMLKSLDERNDRVRATAYGWYEHHQDLRVVPRLLAAVDREEAEFVRPALTRTLAAYGADAKVRQTLTGLVMRGQDLFRAVVIEALGEYKAGYALQPIMDVARLEGPLQDDAVLAIGRIGDKRGLPVLADLQRVASRNLQPSIAAAICLIGSNCGSHAGYLLETLKFALSTPGYQELLRATANGLAALAVAGNQEAAAALFERGGPTRDPERAAIALALGTIAIRNPALTIKVLEQQAQLDPAIELLREAFDMLEEDLEEEQFFVTVRRAYWAAAAASPARKVAGALIQKLEF
jgi:HEAT repeat protein